MANSNNEPLLQLELPGIQKLKSGKVREIFDLGDRLLFVATDRISAFDCIMPNGIPRKGEVLTQISYFWFDADRVVPAQPPAVQGGRSVARRTCSRSPHQLARRSHDREKGRSRWPSNASCAATWPARGWKEYQKTQTVCGIKLPAGPEGILRTARADLHARHQGRNRPRRKYFLRRKPPRSSGANIAEQAARPEPEDLQRRPRLRPRSAASSSPTPSSSSACSTAS